MTKGILYDYIKLLGDITQIDIIISRCYLQRSKLFSLRQYTVATEKSNLS